MKSRSVRVMVTRLFIFMVPLANLSARADSGFADYASGFYTRGLETGTYLDQGSGIINPFYIPVQAWSVVPRVTLTLTHDNNIFLSADDPEESTTLAVVPGVLMLYGRPDHHHLYLDASLKIKPYDSSGNLDGLNDRLLTIGAARITPRSILGASAGYRYTESADTLVGQRIVKEDVILVLDGEQKISAKSSLGVSGSTEWNDYEDPELTDYRRWSADVRLYQQSTPNSDVYVALGVGEDNSDAPDELGDFEFYNASLGFRGRQTPKVTMDGSVGYEWRERKDDNDDDTAGNWISSLGINYTPTGFLMFYFNVDAEVRPAVNSLGQSTFDQRYTLGATRRLFSERLRGNASAFIGNVDYTGTAPAGQERNQDREDEYWGYNLGLDYFTTKDISIGLTYSYFDNTGMTQGTEEEKRNAAYDSGQWVLRLSWNY